MIIQLNPSLKSTKIPFGNIMNNNNTCTYKFSLKFLETVELNNNKFYCFLGNKERNMFHMSEIKISYKNQHQLYTVEHSTPRAWV